jgi:hypothetical protein
VLDEMPDQDRIAPTAGGISVSSNNHAEDTFDQDQIAPPRVVGAFAAEIEIARADIETSGFQLGDPDTAPVWRTSHRRSRLRVSVYVTVFTLVALVLGVGLWPVLHASHPGAADRYSDGIPTTWNGQPVLRGEDAIAKARSATDATPFYVALWASPNQAHGCGSDQLSTELDGTCRDMSSVGDQPGMTSTTLAAAIRFSTASMAPGPVIVRVHAHDAAAADCAPGHRQECDGIMVGDQIVWNGDSVTAPQPVSTDDVARVFGVQESDLQNLCQSLPGARAYPLGDGYGSMVMLFPTSAAVAAVAPQAAAQGSADGTASSTSSGLTECAFNSDEGAMAVSWFARANVLVEVNRPAAVAPASDPLLNNVPQLLRALPAH